MRVAFLGLGIMGSRMAANLARDGIDLTVWNRTESVAGEFCAEHQGTRQASSPADAARDSEIVITMVVDGPQVEHVLLGDEGVATTAQPGELSRFSAATSPLLAALSIRHVLLVTTTASTAAAANKAAGMPSAR